MTLIEETIQHLEGELAKYYRPPEATKADGLLLRWAVKHFADEIARAQAWRVVRVHTEIEDEYVMRSIRDGLVEDVHAQAKRGAPGPDFWNEAFAREVHPTEDGDRDRDRLADVEEEAELVGEVGDASADLSPAGTVPFTTLSIHTPAESDGHEYPAACTKGDEYKPPDGFLPNKKADPAPKAVTRLKHDPTPIPDQIPPPMVGPEEVCMRTIENLMGKVVVYAGKFSVDLIIRAMCLKAQGMAPSRIAETFNADGETVTVQDVGNMLQGKDRHLKNLGQLPRIDAQRAYIELLKARMRGEVVANA